MYTRAMSSPVILGGGAPEPPPPPPEVDRGIFWGTGTPSRSGPATWNMKNVPDAFAAPAYDRMSRSERATGTGSVSDTVSAVQSAKSPSIRIPEGAERKYAPRPEPATVTGRGAGADWRETEIGVPDGKPAAVTETVTDAFGAALVRVTCGADETAVTPVV